MVDGGSVPTGRPLRVVLTQWHATGDVQANLATAIDLIGEAKAARPDIVLLPENCLAIGTNDEMRASALRLESPEIGALCRAAGEAGTTVVLGGLKRKDEQGVIHNTAVVIGPDGRIVGGYDKIHLFNAVVGSQSFEASRVESAGDEPAILAIGDARVGLTICYDVRFPDLYRKLALAGAQVFLIPSAFTYTTGEAHWETLLRARAIENAAFVVASATVRGANGGPESFATWGHALAIDPWGKVLADLGTAQKAWQLVELDLGRVREIRKAMPVLRSTRPDAYAKDPKIIVAVREQAVVKGDSPTDSAGTKRIME